MELSRRTEPLRLLAERLNQAELRLVAGKPGVNEVLRVSLYYHDARLPSCVSTLKRGYGAQCGLTVVYEKADQAVQFDFTVPLDRFQKVFTALRVSKFDTMDDEPELPFMGVDLCLVERASGSFYHDIVFSPTSAKGHHREIMLAIRTHLPEAVRELAG